MDAIFGSLYVTSNNTFFHIARALDELKRWMNSDDGDFRLIAISMQQKFDKCWGDIEKMNVLIYMGTILDPKMKFVGLKLAFARMYASPRGKELSQIVYHRATSLFEDYRKMYTPFTPHNDDSFCTPSHSTICDLKKDIENQMNAHRYPILAYLARDALAMPISTVASESAFSIGGRHLDPFRSSLTPKIGSVLGKVKKKVLKRKNGKKWSNMRKIDGFHFSSRVSRPSEQSGN
uniref:Uncharacterized protein n=1 Tax=Chenopodium quinoa TaxID=63459 RepID=A0A803MEC0_CHEQI